MSWYVGIEIGGTKLQIAIGRGEGEPFRAFRRAAVDAQQGAGRIREQIREAIADLLRETQLDRSAIGGVGIGFGGPVDTRTGTVVVSNQVAEWEQFPLVEWVREEFGWAAALHNDADTAALAEARFGAGRGHDPVMYVTVGSGIGGGIVIGGKIYRGSGAGAMEIGHLRPKPLGWRVGVPVTSLESVASGFGIEERARRAAADRPGAGANPPPTAREIALAAEAGDALCRDLMADATDALGWALAQAIALVNPARIVIGGGVSLIGEAGFFEPVRRACRAHLFEPFAGIAEIVAAALGEEVVVYGALALAREQKCQAGLPADR